MNGKVRLSLDITSELNGRLEKLAEKNGGTKSEFLRRAIVIMSLILESQEQGNEITITDKEKKISKIIIA